MFKSVLIANRGEIACRISRTAKRLGLRCIAVFSDADERALHVREADEAIRIGPAEASLSYLAIEKIIEAARLAGAECIHPGYGFLSENAEFAEACAVAQIAFVGPPPQAIRAMGLKDRAKALMEKANVPVVPGYHGEMQDSKFLKQKAYEIGYPVLIKAAAGGGGKGMRRVNRHADFDDALQGARREAKSSFGNERVLIEKYVTHPRHIEFQIFADRSGRTIHLGERDCSLQRRHQKIMEESPAPGMNAQLRKVIGDAAVAAAQAAGYLGAGTVEFIADGSDGLRADRFWFMEMNTRLQVEHPVTEAVTGFDLVEWQFRIAAGESLPVHQVRFEGHAVEARIYAEDPARGFLPSTGRLIEAKFPASPGVRVDTGVEAGSEITPYYDPMMAKLIVYGKTREEAIAGLSTALEETIVVGPQSNVGFLSAVCRLDAFRKGDLETGLVDDNLAQLVPPIDRFDRAAAALGAEKLLQRKQSKLADFLEETDATVSPWDASDAFQLSGTRRLSLPIVVDGETAIAEVDYGAGSPAVSVDGIYSAKDALAVWGPDAIYVLRLGRQTKVSSRGAGSGEVAGRDRTGVLCAPMHGKLLELRVKEGDKVAAGQPIAIIEAMKMEHTLLAPFEGFISELPLAAGAQVPEGAIIARVLPGPRIDH
ncbi:MAG TPA: biotin carboxylase N-terminal domain-containing protein [Pseudolabrys sp.]|nr:biotin carboxylase N-terminal domain-containing protein [Pseudolabrys sp.]